jgi:hypothetical protein
LARKACFFLYTNNFKIWFLSKKAPQIFFQ